MGRERPEQGGRRGHRFENHAVRLKDTVFWDFLHLWGNVLEALRRCAGGGFGELAGLGVDSWNLDFGLIGEDGMLLANPLSYRDSGDGGIGGEVAEQISEQISNQELYEASGLAVFPITGLSRLLQMQRGASAAVLGLARWYLPIPDLVRYYLSGEVSVEETISWGSQLVDIRTRGWNGGLIERLGLPERVFPELVPPGSRAGTLSRSVSEATGVAPCPVLAAAEHDTISAAFVAAALDAEAAILSVGTWSILGCLVDTPLTTREARELGFMNELACGGIFVARNLMGFYLLEELVRGWRARGLERDYQELAERARSAPGAFRIDPNDPGFFAPPNMQEALREYCLRTGQKAPEDPGPIVRALYQGLAGSYAKGLEELRRLTERGFERMVMVGGAVRRPWFCRLVADGCRVELLAGPAEATVVGNLCLQALTSGRLRAEELGPLVRRSFPVQRFAPRRSRLTGEAQCAPWIVFTGSWRTASWSSSATRPWPGSLRSPSGSSAGRWSFRRNRCFWT